MKENDQILKEPQAAFYLKPLQKEETTANVLNMLSLFSGCGGMDLGFEGGFAVHENCINRQLNPDFFDFELENNFVQLSETRFKTTFANDILKEARNAWVHNFTNNADEHNIYKQQSIVDLVKLHREGIKVFPDNIDIVTGGFPCQDFSVAGKRKGFESHKNHLGKIIENENAPTDETRGKLYMWMREVIEITKPKIFVAENVKGLVNLSNVKKIIQQDFAKTGNDGYIVLEPQVLHAADYGVPQSRERVFFIGISKSALNNTALKQLQKAELNEKYTPYPKPSHSKTENGLKPWSCVKDVLAHLSEPENSDDLSHKFYSKAKFMGAHCQGQTEVKLNGLGPTIRAEHHGNIEFRRLGKKNGGKYLNELKAGMAERRLSPRECGLIQTFPPDYQFVIPNKNGRKGSYNVSPSKAYKIIGNAVPPLLAYHIAKRLEKIWGLYFN